MLINQEKYMIFFGNNKSCDVDYKTSAFEGFCKTFATKYGLEKVLFNKQVHGAEGFMVDSVSAVQKFKNISFEGDFLVTDQKNVGIGVLTADCLPILFYDRKNEVTAAIHAGWRSAVQGICGEAFRAMNKNYGTMPQGLDVFFGPCAKSCCYEVQPDFLSNLDGFSFKKQIIQKRGASLFFDNVLLNKLLLAEIGLDSERINCDHNICTICNHSFNSYRRDSQTNLRQISFIALKN
jgi:polyphenol oxidase